MSVQTIHSPRWMTENVLNHSIPHAHAHAHDGDRSGDCLGMLESTTLGVNKMRTRIRKTRNIKYALVSGDDAVVLPEGTRVTFNPKKSVDAFLEKFAVFSGADVCLRLSLGADVIAEIGSDSTIQQHPSARHLLAFPRKDKMLVITVAE